MTAFAIAVPFESEQQLAAEAARYGHTVLARCSGADELAARVPALRPEAVLVSAAPQYLNAHLLSACDAAGVPLIVTASGPEQHRLARSLGIIDALDGEPSWRVLMPDAAPVADAPAADSARVDSPAATDTSSPYAPPTARSRRPGGVVAVWGPSGAPGRTSLAIAIAAELADAGVSVALADADTHAASIDPALGLLDEAPGFAAA
ncbi:MAG TPA: regulator, partial [Pseudolysinimonas sp.]|nr:regulator [Pseudolysinimonas sp.]